MKNIKKCLLLMILCITIFSTNVFAQRNIKITLNGEVIKTDVSPFIKNSRTLVPIRFISEKLNYNVSWNEKEQRVNINNGVNNLDLTINSKKVLKNGDPETIDVAPEIYKNRTFVPIRFISENFGVKVDWNEKTSTVILTKSSESNKNLTKEENSYLNSVKTITDNISKDLKDIKSYYFENASNFSREEVKKQVALISKDLDKNYNELNNLTPPDKFKQSYNLYMKALGTSRVIVSTYDKAFNEDNPKVATELMKLQTDYSVKLKDANDCMNAELQGKEYIPDKDIKNYNEKANDLLNSQKLDDLIKSLS